ncbi:hypothetical protein LLG10_06285 [bacterium]|nr:hypothetical protein [bacterium]
MPLKKRDIIASLERKGFQIHESDHRYLYFYWSNGKKTSIKTKISHGSGNEIDDNLVHLMATQCYLSKNDFVALIECSLSQNGYEEKLISNGHSRG